MGRPTKKEKACPICGKMRERIYHRTYVGNGKDAKVPLGWLCWGNMGPDPETDEPRTHPIELRFDQGDVLRSEWGWKNGWP